MPEEKQLSAGEVKRTIGTALAAAFGFVIALMWNNVVVGALKVAGVSTDMAEPTWTDWGYLAGIAVVITILMVILIIIVSRLGKK